MEFVIGVTAVAGCYLAIIAMYVWVFRTISEIRKEMYQHMNMADQHVPSKDLVFRGECNQVVKRIEQAVVTNKEGIADFKS